MGRKGSGENSCFDCARQGARLADLALLKKQARRLEWGAGQVVAVLDSGVDGSHPDLHDRVIAAVDYTGEPAERDQIDVYGHGTFVAGIVCANGSNGQVLGLAPCARVYAIKVVDDAGKCAYGRLTSGLRWVSDCDASVVCIPLGCMSPPPPECAELLEKLVADGRLVVAATIEPPPALQSLMRRSVMYPAAFPGVLAVTESDRPSEVFDLKPTSCRLLRPVAKREAIWYMQGSWPTSTTFCVIT